MYTNQVDVISNKATWRSKVCELVDEDDSTTTDLTNPALAVDIVVTITRDYGSGITPTVLATASIADGQVHIPGPGFYWQFEVADLTALCAGTYRLGVKVTIDGFVNDVIDGTVVVIEGN
jgi:hypothetical protein